MDFPPPNNAEYFNPSNISSNPSTTDFPTSNPNYQPILPQNNEPMMSNSYLYPSNNQINNYNYLKGQNEMVKDNHINSYGYFYIEPNMVLRLENQQKINIVVPQKFSCLRLIPTIFFFILSGVGGFLTGMTEGALFPIIIVGFVGFTISGVWMSGICKFCCCKSYVRYDDINKIVEIKCEKKININLDLIEKIEMEDTNSKSVFNVVNKTGEKIKLMEVPLYNGVPFAQGQKILNDFINFWKNKENISTIDKPL